ncbi:MAG: YggS family pyridoxal phosphate-dependent enzyme [Deltaproteobacteria bacterium]|nr:YggS family pyridoxal phosphate-dependent enzyme [Deltaproteobacteria bacterium]
MKFVEENIQLVREKITEAALRSGRDPSEVRLMAVTKTVDDERIQKAITCGIDIIGENYVQEARRKIEKTGHSVEWHMIGHLQSNKAKYAVKLFDMIHSVDRLSLARELDRRSGAAGVVTRILIEVNTSGEETKSGAVPAGVIPLIGEISTMEHLSIRGLMTMPAWYDDPEKARPSFIVLRELRDRIAECDMPNVRMDELSMGMTDDFPVAVEEGATIVRIGRAIFGERT